MVIFASYKDLLLNMFIILAPLVFYQYTFRENKLWRNIFIYALFVVPLMLTMIFPIHANETLHDLRAVPLAVGSLYGGVFASIPLYVSLISYRYFLGGGLNIFHYMLALTPSFFVIFCLSKSYSSSRLRTQILFAAFATLFIKTSVLLIYFTLQGKFKLSFAIIGGSFPLTIAECVLAGFCVYIIEATVKSRRLQTEVMKAEKIKIVSEIAASVAHEVRNPLTAVRGFIQLLGEGQLPEDKRKQYAEICLEELDRAQMIISDYLSLAKPEHNQTEYFNVKDEIQYIANILGSLANYQNVQILNEVKEDIVVYGNRSKFRQAIINFGKNSIEAMPEGGVLEFRSTVEDRKLELLLIDTGTGMTSEQIARLGTPYYSTKEKGTGLGTMVSYNIIRNMNGRVEVTSKPGTGTTCRITLPLPEK